MHDFPFGLTHAPVTKPTIGSRDRPAAGGWPHRGSGPRTPLGFGCTRTGGHRFYACREGTPFPTPGESQNAVPWGLVRRGQTRSPLSPRRAGVAATSARKTVAGVGYRSEDEQTIAHIRRIGGSVERDENDPNRPVVTAFLDGPLISDEDLVDLGRFVKLQRLSLLDSHISDAGLDHLMGLAELRWLYLSRTQVTDRGLGQLRGLTKIQELGLHRTRISDDGLAVLGGLKGLRILDIQSTSTTDAGLAHLQGLADLRKLDLRETQVTDAGMKSLRGLTHLWSLNLAATRVGDSGLADLEGLTRLQQLDLSGTEVTDSGLRAIRKALPEATIIKRPEC